MEIFKSPLLPIKAVSFFQKIEIIAVNSFYYIDSESVGEFILFSDSSEIWLYVMI